MKSILSVSLLAFAGITIPAHSATLDFSGSICSLGTDGGGGMVACVNNRDINQSYGDAASVNISYIDVANSGAVLNSLNWWDSNYNTLSGVAWGGNDVAGSHNRIEFNPADGFTVTLTGFQLGAYSDTTRTTNLRILDLVTSAVLVDYGTTSVGTASPNAPTNYVLNLASANGLVIEWQNDAYNVGIDSIDFDVSETDLSGVPEPSTFALLGTGLGIAAIARRKRII